MLSSINKEGLSIVKKYEGLRLTSYLCPAGIPTIGYGHTGKDVVLGITISEQYAEQLLIQDLQAAERAVARLVTRSLTSNQYSALCSFVYNLGAGTLQRSTLRIKCNREDDKGTAAEFLKYAWSGKRKLPGLVQRRAEEMNLYKA